MRAGARGVDALTAAFGVLPMVPFLGSVKSGGGSARQEAAAALKGSLTRAAKKNGDSALLRQIADDYRRIPTQRFLEKYDPERYTVPYEPVPKFQGESLPRTGEPGAPGRLPGAEPAGGGAVVAQQPTHGYDAGLPGGVLPGRGAGGGSNSGLTDPEGRLLLGRYIVGRDIGGVDRVLSPAATDDVIGRVADEIAFVPRTELGPRIDGQVLSERRPEGLWERVEIYDKLDPGRLPHVKQHELGHALEIPTGMRRQIENDPVLTAEAMAVSKRVRGGMWKTGEDDAYLSTPAELAADIVHAYQMNPGWFRDAHPSLAKLVRDHMNDAPRSRDIIQFNSLAPWIAMLGGGAGLSALYLDDEDGM